MNLIKNLSFNPMKPLCFQSRVSVIFHRIKRLALGFTTILMMVAATENHISFSDLAGPLGVVAKNTNGGKQRKQSILETTGNGIVVFDYDRDGREDVLLLSGSGSPGEPTLPATLYRNSPTGLKAVPHAIAPGWAQAACAGDLDNDGWPDLLITYYGINRLYRNDGAGGFLDITAKAGLPVTGLPRWGSGCTLLDYDRDGRLDIFVANYIDLDLAKAPKPGANDFCRWKEIPVACGPRGLPLARNVLYQQQPDGRFRDVSAASGILKPGGRYALQAVSADFDDDGWPDIYVACDMTPSLLYRNRRDGTFEERGVEAGVAYNFDGRLQSGMGVAVADYDNDGRLDIAKTNFSGDLTSLYHNDDGRFFTDVSREAGLAARQLLGWGIAFFDADGDGWRDLLIANGHIFPEVETANVGETYRLDTLLYRNEGNGRLRDITKQAGPALQVPRPARGLALGDLDGDGRPEAVILNIDAAPTVLRNSAPAGGKFLNLRLEGTRMNRSALGARVTVEAGGIRQTDEVMSGASYYSQHSAVLHFGLGAAAQATVTVKWLGGAAVQRFTVPANALCELQEGRAEPACRPYSREPENSPTRAPARP